MRWTKLRPRHGWRALIGEVGVIVLGVLIALAAQQIADDWQWERRVEQTKDNLDEQLAWAIVQVAERYAVDPCLSARLTGLASELSASDGRWQADPAVFNSGKGPVVRNVIPAAYRPPGRPYPDDVWQQAKVSGALEHMTAIDIERYTYAFKNVSDLAERGEIEGDLAAQLSFLSYDGVLEPSERGRALATIARLDRLNALALRSAESLQGYMEALDIKLSRAQEAELRDNLATQQSARGDCVDPEASMRALAPLRAP